MPPHVLVDFVSFPLRHGRSVTEFLVWDAHEVRLRCPHDVSSDIGEIPQYIRAERVFILQKKLVSETCFLTNFAIADVEETVYIRYCNVRDI